MNNFTSRNFSEIEKPTFSSAKLIVNQCSLHRIVSILFAFCFLFCGTVVYGDVTVGTGTSTSSTGPFCNNYRYSWHESIYTAAEIGGACRITAVKYYCTSNKRLSTQEFKIYMGVRSSSTFSDGYDWTPETDLTLVYSSNSQTIGTGTANTWQTFTFNQNGSAFEYEGTENLVVVVVKKASTYESSLYWQYTSASMKAIYRQSDSDQTYANYRTDINCGTSNMYYRPNTIFTTSAPTVTCKKPTSLNVTNITQSGATIGWAANGGSAWQYAVNKTGATPASWTTAGTNPFTVTGLEDSYTDYYFFVRTNCGGTYSKTARIKFRTAPDLSRCGGSGTESDPYLICDKAALELIADLTNDGWETSGKYFKVTANISGVTKHIGNNDHSFCGNFDGNDKTINLSIPAPTAYGDVFRGLFGKVGTGAYIHNVITSGSVSGGSYGHAGGIIGQCSGNNIKISDCTNGANVSVTAYQTVGGIIGYCTSCTMTIYNCVNTGSVTNNGSEYYAGGIVGEISGYSTTHNTMIDYCYNTGTVKGAYCGGGIVGMGSYFTIKNCYNKGSVSSTVTTEYYYGAGGIVGRIQECGDVYNCYNVGNISGSGASNRSSVGGICAVNYMKGTIRNCYNGGTLGNVNSTYLGGIVGYNYNQSGYYCRVENCYSKGIGNVCGATYTSTNLSVTGCYTFTHNDSPLSNTISSTITVNDVTSNDLCTILNAWVSANGRTQYNDWLNASSSTDNANSASQNGGMPKFCKCVTAPTISVTGVGDRQITVSWGTVTGASRYTLYYGQFDPDLENSWNISNITGTSQTVTRLTNGVPYKFAVMPVGNTASGYCEYNKFSIPKEGKPNCNE